MDAPNPNSFQCAILFDHQMLPILVWISPTDVAPVPSFQKAGAGSPLALDEKSKLSDTQDLHANGPMPKILTSVKPFSRFSRSKPFWPFINYI